MDKANGKDVVVPEQETHAPLTQDRAKSIEAGMIAFRQVEQELDTARNDLAAERLRNRELTVQVEGLERDILRMESEIISMRLQRDQAVAQRAQLEAFIQLIRRTLDAAELPTPVGEKEPEQEPEAPDPEREREFINRLRMGEI